MTASAPSLSILSLCKSKRRITFFSFGASSIAFSMATSLSIAYPEWYVIIPSMAYAGTVGYSRMYLGVHYPSDVLVGAIVGAGSSWLTYRANKWLRRSKHKSLSVAW